MTKNNYMGNKPQDYYKDFSIPKKELIKLVQLNELQEVEFIVTSNIFQTEYFLYEKVNNIFKKTKKQDNPIFPKVEKALQKSISDIKNINNNEESWGSYDYAKNIQQ